MKMNQGDGSHNGKGLQADEVVNRVQPTLRHVPPDFFQDKTSPEKAQECHERHNRHGRDSPTCTKQMGLAQHQKRG